MSPLGNDNKYFDLVPLSRFDKDVRFSSCNNNVGESPYLYLLKISATAFV